MKLPSRAFCEALAERALARLPERFRSFLYNVQIEVRDEPGPEAGKWNGSTTLLGLYTGLKREQMASPFSGSYMPARIVLYRRNLCALCADEEQLARRIQETLLHEIGHHFGFDEAAIRAAMAGRASARSARRRPRR